MTETRHRGEKPKTMTTTGEPFSMNPEDIMTGGTKTNNASVAKITITVAARDFNQEIDEIIGNQQTNQYHHYQGENDEEWGEYGAFFGDLDDWEFAVKTATTIRK